MLPRRIRVVVADRFLADAQAEPSLARNDGGAVLSTQPERLEGAIRHSGPARGSRLVEESPSFARRSNGCGN